jgi:AcrR family transcriptional regulator
MTTSATIRKPTKKAAEPAQIPRMLQLIEAAENIFLANGYHAATMSDVAKAAGMSKKTVYTMVESKGELFAALLAHHQSLLKFPALPADASVRDILVSNLLALGRFLLAPKQISILRLIMGEYTHSPDLGRIFMRSRVTKPKGRIEDCLVEIALTHACGGADPKELSAMLFGMALGEFHLGVLIGFRTAPSKQTLEKRIRSAVDIFLAACSEK